MRKHACLALVLMLAGTTRAGAADGIERIGIIDSDRMALNITNTISLSRDGRRLLLEGPVNDVQVATVFDVTTGQPIFEAKKITRAELSPDGKYLAYVVSNQFPAPERLHLRSLDQKVDVYTYDQSPSIIYVQFDGTGDHLLHSMPLKPEGGARYGRLRAVAVKDGSTDWTITVPTEYGGMQLEVGTGERFAMQTDRQPWTIFDASTGKQTVALQIPSGEYGNSLFWSGDEQRVLVVTEKRGLILFDPWTGVGEAAGKMGFPSSMVSPDLSLFIGSFGSSELVAFSREKPDRRVSIRVGPRLGSSLRYSPISGIVCAIEDGEYGGRLIVSKLPPIAAWSPAPLPTTRPAESSMKPQQTEAKSLSLPTTGPADAAWWTAQAAASYSQISDPMLAARVGWKLSAVQSLHGDVASARQLLESANRTGVAPAVQAEWHFNDQLQAFFELARRLARTDVAAARKLLNDLDDNQRFIADLMPNLAVALGCIDGGRPDEAVGVINTMHGAARDTVAEECALTLSARGQFEAAGWFIDLMRPDSRRAGTNNAVALAAVKGNQLDWAIGRLPEVAQYPMGVYGGPRMLMEALAAAAESAGRQDILKTLEHFGLAGMDSLIRGRALAMARRGDWDALDRLSKPLKPLDRMRLLRDLAPEIAKRGSIEQLKRFEQTDKLDQVDWDSVVFGLCAVGQLDEAMKHLDEPGTTPGQREQMRQRVSSELRRADRIEEAEKIVPLEPRQINNPGAKAIFAWKRHDMAAYQAALAEFDQLYGKMLAGRADQLAAMRAGLMRSAGDLNGAWTAYEQAATAPPNGDVGGDRGKASVDFYLDARHAGNEAVAAKAANAIEQPATQGFSDPILELVYSLGRQPNFAVEVAHCYGLLRTPAGRTRLAIAAARQSAALAQYGGNPSLP